MLGDMFLWLVANLKQGGIYFIKQALPPNISAGSVHSIVQGRRKVGAGGALAPQFLADQLTLSRTGGDTLSPPSTTSPPDFQTLRQPCKIMLIKMTFN